jgi:hypothetical protein
VFGLQDELLDIWHQFSSMSMGKDSNLNSSADVLDTVHAFTDLVAEQPESDHVLRDVFEERPQSLPAEWLCV